MKRIFAYMCVFAFIFCAAACGTDPDKDLPLRDNTVPMLEPDALGTTVLENEYLQLDVSNVHQGYVMLKYIAPGEACKVIIGLSGTPDTEKYIYNINNIDEYTVFPLTQGSGTYDIKIYQHLEGTSYMEVFTEELQVELTDEYSPFLYPNQYVDFSPDNQAVNTAAEVVSTAKKDLDVVEAIYDFVSEHIAYDENKAEMILSDKITDYLPVIDETLESQSGICFDYAALMTAMLRSQRIPTKLVIGYSSDVYHAWINVYITDIGWIDKFIEFNGTEWVMMDPTFNSNLKNPKQLEQYIGNGSVYRAMFYY